MAANSVQFHKERSLREFLESYGTGAQCAAAVFEWRWVQGFARSECGHAEVYSRVQIRGLLECRYRRHKTSITAGTLFAHGKLR